MNAGELTWLDPVVQLMKDGQRQGGFLLCVADYRPDVARAVAHGLDLGFFDFRAEIMVPLGWNAHRLTLEDLTETLEETASGRGLVVHNVEALLATKDETDRRRWLEQFLKRAWPFPIILPLFLFAGDAPDDDRRVLRLPAEWLPEETLLGRLLFWGG